MMHTRPPIPETAVSTIFIFLVTFTVSAESLAVAVAANFQPVLIRIAESFSDKTSHHILISSASTGNLTSQLLNGAPYDVFLAADTIAVQTLTSKQKIDPTTVATYAFGTIVAVSTRVDSSVSLEQALADARRIAIAQPTVAPYGMAAKQVLENSGVWQTLNSRFVYARSVGQCFQFAVTGSADIAFVALSTLTASRKPFRGVWHIDSTRYKPIEQRMCIIVGTPHRKTAELFCNFLRSPDIATIIRSFGYTLPPVEGEN